MLKSTGGSADVVQMWRKVFHLAAKNNSSGTPKSPRRHKCECTHVFWDVNSGKKKGGGVSLTHAYCNSSLDPVCLYRNTRTLTKHKNSMWMVVVVIDAPVFPRYRSPRIGLWQKTDVAITDRTWYPLPLPP